MKHDLKVWLVLVPETLNGKKINRSYHRAWDKKVRDITKGLTIHYTAKGQWINPEDGKLTLEGMIPVHMACTDEQIEIITDMTVEYYEQKVIMYYPIANKVFFKKRKTNEMDSLRSDKKSLS